MAMNRCKDCREIYTRFSNKYADHCPACFNRIEGRFEAVTTEITQLLKVIPDGILHSTVASERALAYIFFRYRKSPDIKMLKGQRRGSCYFCSDKLNYKLELACIECLRDLAVLLDHIVQDDGGPLPAFPDMAARAPFMDVDPEEALDDLMAHLNEENDHAKLGSSYKAGGTTASQKALDEILRQLDMEDNVPLRDRNRRKSLLQTQQPTQQGCSASFKRRAQGGS